MNPLFPIVVWMLVDPLPGFVDPIHMPAITYETANEEERFHFKYLIFLERGKTVPLGDPVTYANLIKEMERRRFFWSAIRTATYYYQLVDTPEVQKYNFDSARSWLTHAFYYAYPNEVKYKAWPHFPKNLLIYLD